MKKSIFTFFVITFASISQGAGQEQVPAFPVGSLSAYPTIVQAGTHPTLTWDVTIPEAIDEIIEIEPPGTIKPKRCLVMDVRVLGASVKRTWVNSRGQVVDWEWVETEALVSYNGSSYDRIFFDTHDDVAPNYIVHSQIVDKNSSIDFGSRYVLSSGSWSTLYTSTNSSYNVVALKNGDTPPTTTPMYQQPTIESFILPYLDEDGNIELGPRDIIYLMELTHTDRNDGGFDLQDMALLVSFYDEVQEDGTVIDCESEDTDEGTIEGDTNKGKTNNGNGNGNNGHGNNEDGVDSSNPGNSKDGEDTDPDVDDEKQRGRRKE
ncbi:hypothetical protein VSU19_14285 [Verrucomicrobiales bacterium BCK34]|nr:hypothetical protein [Verrucomicrobiales bacterium BCK34]